MLVGVGLGVGETLLDDRGVPDEAGWVAVVAGVELGLFGQPLGRQPGGIGLVVGDDDGGAAVGELRQVEVVALGRRVPHQHRRGVGQQWSDPDDGLIDGGGDQHVGVDQAEVDAVVGVHLRGHRLEADRRAAGAQGEPGAGVLALRHQGAGDRLGLGVCDVVGAEHLEQGTHIGLRLPLQLDHDLVTACVSQLLRRGRSLQVCGLRGLGGLGRTGRQAEQQGGSGEGRGSRRTPVVAGKGRVGRHGGVTSWAGRMRGVPRNSD